MTEAEFWVKLEHRVSGEFAGLAEKRYQYFWCDGFVPFQYQLDMPTPRIIGRCWICNGQRYDEWEFALLLPRPWRTREDIDWAALLPPTQRTRWMAFDESRRYLEMEPGVAVPDDGDSAAVSDRRGERA